VEEAWTPPSSSSLLTEDDLGLLPEPVRRYLRFTRSVGRPRVAGFALTAHGTFRLRPDDPWTKVRIRQTTTLQPARREFDMRGWMRGLPVHSRHVFEPDHARFDVWLLGVIRVVKARGAWADQSETVTFFNDLCLFAPSALVDAPIQWEELAPDRVRARYTLGSHTVAGELRFAEDGALVDFVSDDRYRGTSESDNALQRWSTPVSAYGTFGDHRLPGEAAARWLEADGELVYARFELTELRYRTIETPPRSVADREPVS